MKILKILGTTGKGLIILTVIGCIMVALYFGTQLIFLYPKTVGIILLVCLVLAVAHKLGDAWEKTDKK